MKNPFHSLSTIATRAARAAAVACALAFLATDASADRTITVSSMTGSAATLVFGPTDCETYYLYMAYGAADGGVTESGWDNFDEIGEIDSNDNAYKAELPAGWKTSVKAMRFFLLDENNSVAASTDAILASVLVVEAGSPT